MVEITSTPKGSKPFSECVSVYHTDGPQNGMALLVIPTSYMCGRCWEVLQQRFTAQNISKRGIKPGAILSSKDFYGDTACQEIGQEVVNFSLNKPSTEDGGISNLGQGVRILNLLLRILRICSFGVVKTSR